MRGFLNVVFGLVCLGLFIIGLTDLFTLEKGGELMANLIYLIRGPLLVIIGFIGLAMQSPFLNNKLF